MAMQNQNNDRNMWGKFLDWRQRNKERFGIENVIMPELKRRVVKPLISPIAAELPFGKDPETRFDMWKTPEGDFSAEEKIEHLVNLTGVFPFSLVMEQKII